VIGAILCNYTNGIGCVTVVTTQYRMVHMSPARAKVHVWIEHGGVFRCPITVYEVAMESTTRRVCLSQSYSALPHARISGMK
jgi:hypothetical protein